MSEERVEEIPVHTAYPVRRVVGHYTDWLCIECGREVRQSFVGERKGHIDELVPGDRTVTHTGKTGGCEIPQEVLDYVQEVSLALTSRQVD